MELKNYQKEGIRLGTKFLKENKCFYLADEMGLGKTVQAVSLLGIFNANSFVVVTTASGLYMWQEHLKEWFTGPFPEHCLIVTSKRSIPEVKDHSRIIISYALMSQYKEVFQKRKWDFLILDEAQKVKSESAQRTKACLGNLWDACTYKIALSGSPFMSCVTDGFTLFNRMAPDLFKTFKSFQHKYCIATPGQWGTSYSGVRNEKELGRLIRERFYLRRLKENVLSELPEKNFIRITLPVEYAYRVPRSDAEKLESSVKAMLDLLNNDSRVPAVLPTTVIGERRLQGRLKVKPITDYVEDLLEQGLPVILFGYHTDVINGFLKGLEKWNPVVITGATDAKGRRLAVKEFQEGKTLLFIGQIIAAGTVITLTASCNVVLAEYTYVPSEVAQAIDRAHRVGQRDTVNVHYFVVKNSIDEQIVETIIRKSKDFKRVLDD